MFRVVSPHGHYLLLAGLAGTVGDPDYPKWLRLYLSLLVSVVWAAAIAATVVNYHGVKVPWQLHTAMLLVLASLFRVEFGSFRLVKKDEINHD